MLSRFAKLITPVGLAASYQLSACFRQAAETPERPHQSVTGCEQQPLLPRLSISLVLHVKHPRLPAQVDVNVTLSQARWLAFLRRKLRAHFAQ